MHEQNERAGGWLSSSAATFAGRVVILIALVGVAALLLQLTGLVLLLFAAIVLAVVFDAMARLIRAVRDDWGTTIVLIEHDIGLVLGLSDRVTVLDHGSRTADGTPAEIRDDPAVIDAYLGVAHEDDVGVAHEDDVGVARDGEVGVARDGKGKAVA